MNKHVQIRNVAAAVHGKLKRRAAERGLSITDYVKRLIDHDLAKPDWTEVAVRVRAMPAPDLLETSADMIRRERDSH